MKKRIQIHQYIFLPPYRYWCFTSHCEMIQKIHIGSTIIDAYEGGGYTITDVPCGKRSLERIKLPLYYSYV